MSIKGYTIMLHLLASPLLFWLYLLCVPFLLYGWQRWFQAAWQELQAYINWHIVVVIDEAEREIGLVLGVRLVRVAYA